MRRRTPSRVAEVATGLAMVGLPVGFVFLCIAVADGFRLGANEVINFFVAVGTLALAVITVFLASIQRRFYFAELRVSVKTELPDLVIVPLSDGRGQVGDAIYIRLWVENVGNIPAEKVEVYAERLESMVDDRWSRVAAFAPQNLKWANIGGMFYPMISPSMGKHCDLARILDPIDRSYLPHDTNDALGLDDETASLAFEVLAPPNHKGHVIAPGIYRLLLRVAATNVEPSDWLVSLQFDGAWGPTEVDMIENKHLAVAVSSW